MYTGSIRTHTVTYPSHNTIRPSASSADTDIRVRELDKKPSPGSLSHVEGGGGNTLWTRRLGIPEEGFGWSGVDQG